MSVFSVTTIATEGIQTIYVVIEFLHIVHKSNEEISKYIRMIFNLEK